MHRLDPTEAPIAPRDAEVLPLLLVEDSITDAVLVRAMLNRTRLHTELQVVSCLGDAVAAASTVIGCVLLDLGLPDVRGLEGLEMLCQVAPTTPIVILTGNDDLDTASQALARGAQDYLIKGQFDAATLERTIRHARERKRVQLELETRRALNEAVLDSVHSHIAILDANGTITGVNASWRRFAATNGAPAETVGVGVDYLEICRRGAQHGEVGDPRTDFARRIADALDAILAGDAMSFTEEYECHGGGQERWFELHATSLGSAGAVVVHTPITEHKLLQRELAARALRDPLTGLANRALLLDEGRLLLAQRDRAGLVVAFVDLDGFKAVNDQLGHAAGDAVLVEVARRLQATARRGDIVARLGGDEFVVLGQAGDVTAAAVLGRRLAEAIEPPIPLEGRVAEVTGSVGVTHVAPRDPRGLETILGDADRAMFTAKRRQPGSVRSVPEAP